MKIGKTIAFWYCTVNVCITIAMIRLTFGASSASFTHCMSWKKKGKTTTINIHPKKHVITHKHKGKLTSTLQVWNVQYVALQMEYSVK